MKNVLHSTIGVLAGGFVGVLTMCLFTVSSQASHWDNPQAEALGTAPEAAVEQKMKK